MNKKGEVEPKLKIKVTREPDRESEINNLTMQAKGIIKYAKPKDYLIRAVNSTIVMLMDRNALDWREFKKWVREVNPIWLKYISKRRPHRSRTLRIFIHALHILDRI